MKSDRTWLKSGNHPWLLSICVIGLLLSNWVSMSTAAEGPVLSPPPAWPEHTFVPQVTGDILVYLPLVIRPPEPSAWVDTQDREVSLTFYQQEYLGSNITATDWTGDHESCSAGETSEAFRSAVLRRINYYRSMAGIPPLVGLDATYNYKAQAAALMMSVNEMLSHTPDESWECYTVEGDEGAGSSNLYLGVYGPDAIRGYIYDPGTGNYPVGHRRWILYPQTQYMGSGDIPPVDDYASANALWVFDLVNIWGPRPETREAFVAWPPPGYVPYPVVYPRWSFAYAGANFDQASVTMTRMGSPLLLVQQPVVYGYGENTLVWEPQENFVDPPATDTSYVVTVNNVLIDEQPQNFTYTVILFAPE